MLPRIFSNRKLQIQEQLRLLLRIDLSENAWNDRWHKAIFDLARRYDVTFDDASYHALAIVSGDYFVSADEKAGHNRHIKDWTGRRTDICLHLKPIAMREAGVRLYASQQPSDARSDRLLYQVKLALDENARYLRRSDP